MAKMTHESLSPEQVSFKEKLDSLRDLKNKSAQNFYDAKKDCKHVTAYNLKNDSDAWCIICNEDLGWMCPNSPDHACHYFTEPDGKVLLFNGEKIDVPDPDHHQYYETYDRCLFCGNPEERK